MSELLQPDMDTDNVAEPIPRLIERDVGLKNVQVALDESMNNQLGNHNHKRSSKRRRNKKSDHKKSRKRHASDISSFSCLEKEGKTNSFENQPDMFLICQPSLNLKQKDHLTISRNSVKDVNLLNLLPTRSSFKLVADFYSDSSMKTKDYEAPRNATKKISRVSSPSSRMWHFIEAYDAGSNCSWTVGDDWRKLGQDQINLETSLLRTQQTIN